MYVCIYINILYTHIHIPYIYKYVYINILQNMKYFYNHFFIYKYVLFHI